MSRLLEQAKKLPDAPGVYLFRRKEKILYIGKATSLKARVKSYFVKDLGETRGPLLVEMARRADGIDFKKTVSVLEALLLETELIKRHQPPYNTEQKDDKSFNCVVITDEKFPRALVVRQRDLGKKIQDSRFRIQEKYGPFVRGTDLKIALKIIRKIFPFRDTCTPPSNRWLPYSDVLKNIRIRKPCFNRQIGLCPGVCTEEITAKEYQKTIRRLRLFFEGKKKELLCALTRDMKAAAQAEQFEKAGEIKKTFFALRHIQDIALINRENNSVSVPRSRSVSVPRFFRIEAYDVSHFSGTGAVGAMAVVQDGATQKGEYRMFKVRRAKQGDDCGALREILSRRLRHEEWRLPDLIAVDGGAAQRRAAEKEIRAALSSGDSIPVVSVVKNEYHRPQRIEGNAFANRYEKEILLANSEAHRFALRFQRKQRSIAE